MVLHDIQYTAGLEIIIKKKTKVLIKISPPYGWERMEVRRHAKCRIRGIQTYGQMTTTNAMTERKKTRSRQTDRWIDR